VVLSYGLWPGYLHNISILQFLQD